MSPSNRSPQSVQREFRRRRRMIQRLALLTALAAAAIVSLHLLGMMEARATVLALLVGFACAVWVNMHLWRCPACNAHLGKLYLGLDWPKHCPDCGAPLVNRVSG